MKPAAIGFRARSGWATLVVLAGPLDSPTVLDRRRIELVETFTYKFRQPYHTAAELQLPEAEKFIARCRQQANRRARAALRAAQEDLRKRGFRVARCGLLLASGRPLPGLSGVLASHAMIHTADGELFRDALRDAGKRCGLPVIAVKERELYDHAVEELRVQPIGLKRLIGELGRALGPPWGRDEKNSALVAWLALAASAPR